jgi:O-methyltransferase involved in polyketide biosynthesis
LECEHLARYCPSEQDARTPLRISTQCRGDSRIASTLSLNPQNLRKGIAKYKSSKRSTERKVSVGAQCLRPWGLRIAPLH